MCLYIGSSGQLLQVFQKFLMVNNTFIYKISNKKKIENKCLQSLILTIDVFGQVNHQKADTILNSSTP